MTKVLGHRLQKQYNFLIHGSHVSLSQLEETHERKPTITTTNSRVIAKVCICQTFPSTVGHVPVHSMM